MGNNGNKFDMGWLMLTREVNDRVATDEEFAQFVIRSLERHLSGDWGELSGKDKAENDLSLLHKLRLLSAYEKEGLPKIRIITEADRSVTTILFPEEY